jgi:hypothetical protein
MPLWCRHIQEQHMPLYCRQVQIQLRPLWCRQLQEQHSLCSIDTPRCSSCPCGADTSRSSTGLCSVGTLRISKGCCDNTIVMSSLSKKKRTKAYIAKRIELFYCQTWQYRSETNVIIANLQTRSETKVISKSQLSEAIRTGL